MKLSTMTTTTAATKNAKQKSEVYCSAFKTRSISDELREKRAAATYRVDVVSPILLTSAEDDRQQSGYENIDDELSCHVSPYTST